MTNGHGPLAVSRAQQNRVQQRVFSLSFIIIRLLTAAYFLPFPEISSVQMFIEEPIYTEVNPGADEVLECQVDNIGGECRWQKDGKVSEEACTLHFEF